MPISFVGAGTSSANNNADGTPTIPSVNVGDFILLLGILRGLDADANPCTLVGVSGYTQLFNFVHSTGSPCPRLIGFYKFAAAGEGNPTIDITPQATGNTVVGHVCAFRGVDRVNPINILGSTSENASAQNIGAITGITPTVRDGVVIVCGGKCDDWTSVDTLTGDSLTWAEIGEPSSTLGQDAGIVWDYALYDTPAAISNKTFTVTGGASQKALGVMFSLNPDPDYPVWKTKQYQSTLLRM